MAISDKTNELAVFGGEKTVTAAGKRWPWFSDAEIEEVRQCMLRSREDFTEACSALGGGIAEKLETRFAESLGRQHAIATSGGGPALHIACLAAGVQLGDEVITTPYSWGQTVSCILQAGGVPVFADIHPQTLTLDPDAVEDLITDRTRAIVLVHIFGIPADMDRIMGIARRHNLPVIEDCAQAQGSMYKGRPVGADGDIACFSIGSGKNLAAGDGGLLATDDRTLYEKSLLAGMHPGRNKRAVELPQLRDQVDSLIYTYRINTFTAALAYRQMDRLEENNSWRRRNAGHLRRRLEDVPGIRPLDLPDWADPAWHMVPWTFVAADLPGISREQYISALNAEGVPIRDSYVGTPIHMRRTFREKTWWLGNGYPWRANPRGDRIVYREGQCPLAEKRCAELDLMLGGGGWWNDESEQVEQIVQAFRKVTAEPHRLADIEA